MCACGCVRVGVCVWCACGGGVGGGVSEAVCVWLCECC